ncbi:hypothetical protein SBA4_1360030 [Candidatus Sulfopaludibacter sp. SbA4]|nr:hypothetical protein SBA4_1360030 [Candidatus Sulfopaludibacter sp. SbA4]
MNIEILSAGEAEREAHLRKALEARIAEHTGGLESIAFNDPNVEPDILIYLGSRQAKADPNITGRIETALVQKWRVLPLVDHLEDYQNLTPDSLHSINGDCWTSAGQIAENILRQLGVTERDRRVFLSYRRRESTPMALQLYEKLHQAGYLVFLDYFSVERGIRIQERIQQALDEMSFVLLLESAGAAQSKWVAEDEIGYALSHRLGLLSLAWPELKSAPGFPMIPPDRREQLSPDDLEEDGRLTSEAIERTTLRIEREHADQLRARREGMVKNVSELLAEAGHKTIRLGPYSLLQPRSAPEAELIEDLVIRVCPRPANHRDMFELGQDCLRRRAGKEVLGPSAWIVSLPGGYQENLDVARWIGGIQNPQVSFVGPLDIPEIGAKEVASRS